ncbi:MAG: hypothetical protein QOE70_6134 [Chthoniobacter sp.]|jgi:tetratricopeptide (TPR) repeat protein|nr:hypothetical protein [Chthoniobacter sp.]
MRLLCLLAALAFTVSFTACSRQSKTQKTLERGRSFFEAGEFEKAKLLYLSALRLDPQNAEAVKQLGLIWSEQGAPLEATRFLQKARDMNSKDLIVRKKLASALVSLQQIPDARKEAEVVLEQEPEQQDALLILAETARSEDETRDFEVRLQKLDASKLGVVLAKVALALRKKDVPTAEAALNKAVSVDPNSSSVHFAIGTVALSKKDLLRAEEEFKRAAELAPRSGASLAYAQILLQKDPKGASDYLTQLSQKIGDYVPLRILQARIALNDKKPDQALALLEHAFQVDGSNFEARLLQGQVLLGKGDTDKAIDLFKKISENEVYSRMALPRFELGRAYLQKANPSQAIAALTEAVKLQPEYTEALLLLAQLKLQQGDSQNVVDSMRTILQKRPNLLPAQLLLSQAYRSQGNLTEAARVLREQVQATPDAAEPYLLLGLISLQENKRAEAREAFETVRKLAPRNLLAGYHLVELDLAEKKFAEALQRAQSLIQGMPGTPGPFYVLARVHMAQEQWDDAEEALKKSIQLDPNFTAAYDLLVSIYVKNNKLEQASSQTEAFLARNPENTGALLTWGLIQERLRNLEKARDIYQKVLAGNPNSATALNNLAVILAEKFKQLDKAYDLASRAHTLQPEDGSIADTLGWIAYRRQDYQQAVALLQESAEKLPANSEIQFHFGMASYMTGQAGAARTALTKAAAAAGDFPGKSEIPRALAMLGNDTEPARELSKEELEALLKQQPTDLVVRQRLADRLEQDGAFAQAASLWEEALKANPKLLPATLKLARLNAGPLRNPDKALDYAKKARALAPTDPEVAKVAGQAAYQSGNFLWAYSLLQDIARLPGTAAGVLHDLARTAYSLGKVEEAQQIMQRALDSAPDAPQAEEETQFLKLAALEAKPQEIAANESYLQTVLKQHPDDIPALMLEAALRVQRHQPTDAIRTYNAILARLPEFGPAQKRLAALYLDIPDQSQAAFDMATRARKNLPDDPEVAQILAEVRYQRKEYQSVVQLLQESAAKQSLDAKSLFYEGMSRLQLKQMTEGYAILAKALESGLDGPPAEEARRELANQSKTQKP